MTRQLRFLRAFGLAAALLALAGEERTAQAAPGDIYNLGTLGGLESYGDAINDAGQVAGYANTTSFSAYHAFRYTGTPGSGGAMADLGTLGGTLSQGRAINDAGQVAGYANMTGGNSHAFRYTGTPGAGGAMADLGTLGGTEGYGIAINNAGQVAGFAYTTGNTAFHAFRYTGTPGSGGTMVDLGTFGGSTSRATAINDAGQVTGEANTTDDAAIHAFRYTGTPGSGGTMADLGPGSGYGINDAGFVVGRSELFGATLWRTDAGNTAVGLDAWLDAINPTLGAYWTIGDAAAISNNGLITGVGRYFDGPGGLGDGLRAYILDASSLVPEPSTLILTSLGVAALAVRRNRRITDLL